MLYLTLLSGEKRKKMREKGKNLKKYISVRALVLLALFALAATIYFIARAYVPLADALNGSVAHLIRRALAFLSNALPFSFAELILVISPVLIALILIGALRAFRRGEGIRFIAGFLASFSLLLSAYWFTLGIGYHTSPVSERAGLAEVAVDEESLSSTLIRLTEECNALSSELSLDPNGASVMPISFDEACEQIIDAYAVLSEKMPSLGIKSYPSRAKQVALSKPMSALEITGVYTFFTGEANVNVHYPDYNLPFTIAHELAHQRGIAREDEANFIAFLVCKEAESPYIRYSGYINMLEYVASALRRAHEVKYREIYETFDPVIVSELRAYSEFYTSNKKPFWSKLSDNVNDTYLKAQGTEGIISYGLAVRLCVAYYAE